MIVSIANLKQVSNAARLAGQTLLWFAITALIAVAHRHRSGPAHRARPQQLRRRRRPGAPETHRLLVRLPTGIVPGNIFGLQGSPAGSLSFNVLQLIVISAASGSPRSRSARRPSRSVGFVRSALAIVQKVLWWVILLAPLGTVGLIGNAVASYGWESLSSLGVFAGAVYAGLAIVLFVVYPVLLRLHGLSPLRYFAGAWPAIQLAFVSRSSIGTLPVTERVTEQNLGVPRSYASFAVPLGATTKMDGCAAIYPALAAIFVAQFFGVDLSITDYLLIALVSVIGSAATAGVTGAVVMLTLTLSTLGLPLAGVGLLLAIDPILDMGRTAVNVAGQALVPTIVAKREGILDVERYRSTSHRSTRWPGSRSAGEWTPTCASGARHRRSPARRRTARSSRGGPGRSRPEGHPVRSAQPVSSRQQRAEGDRPAGAVAGDPRGRPRCRPRPPRAPPAPRRRSPSRTRRPAARRGLAGQRPDRARAAPAARSRPRGSVQGAGDGGHRFGLVGRRSSAPPGVQEVEDCRSLSSAAGLLLLGGEPARRRPAVSDSA